MKKPSADLKVLMRSVKTGFEPFCRFVAEKKEIVYITSKTERNGG